MFLGYLLRRGGGDEEDEDDGKGGSEQSNVSEKGSPQPGGAATADQLAGRGSLGSDQDFGDLLRSPSPAPSQVDTSHSGSNERVNSPPPNSSGSSESETPAGQVKVDPPTADAVSDSAGLLQTENPTPVTEFPKDHIQEGEEFRQMQCISWHQTRDCDPYGKEVRHGLLSCDAVVPPTASGYCLCHTTTAGKDTAFGHLEVRAAYRADQDPRGEREVKVARSTCKHRSFTCTEACFAGTGFDPHAPEQEDALRLHGLDGVEGEEELRQMLEKGHPTSGSRAGAADHPSPQAEEDEDDAGGCVAFRRTMNCDPQGARDPDSVHDLGCDERIAIDVSGYCECADRENNVLLHCIEKDAVGPRASCSTLCRWQNSLARWRASHPSRKGAPIQSGKVDQATSQDHLHEVELIHGAGTARRLREIAQRHPENDEQNGGGAGPNGADRRLNPKRAGAEGAAIPGQPPGGPLPPGSVEIGPNKLKEEMEIERQSKKRLKHAPDMAPQEERLPDVDSALRGGGTVF